MDSIELMRKATELREYAELEGTELGVACALLIDIVCHYQDYVSEEFFQALEKEVISQLDNFKTNAKIVEHEEAVIQKWSELEWKT